MDGEGKEERTHLRRGRGGGGGGGGRVKEIKYEGGGSGGGVLPCFRVDVGGGSCRYPGEATVLTALQVIRQPQLIWSDQGRTL